MTWVGLLPVFPPSALRLVLTGATLAKLKILGMKIAHIVDKIVDVLQIRHVSC